MKELMTVALIAAFIYVVVAYIERSHEKARERRKQEFLKNYRGHGRS